jgi:hypothetical protein
MKTSETSSVSFVACCCGKTFKEKTHLSNHIKFVSSFIAAFVHAAEKKKDFQSSFPVFHLWQNIWT